MKLSIVSTMYRSAPFIETFCARMVRAAELETDAFEILLVNDGSPDESLQIALALRRNDPRIKVVDLSRNFGHHAAIVAGLEQARGERVFLMDCDLEEQPEWLPQFRERLEASGADVVFGVQSERIASFWSNLFGGMFWSLMRRISSVDLPHNPMTCRLMTRRYVDALLEVGDRVLYLASVFAWTGFRQESLALKKQPRPVPEHGTSYNLSRKITQVVDSVASFSAAPLTLIFFAGFVIWAGSIVIGAFVAIQKILHPDTILSGFTSVILSVWFLGGLIILILGILGLYVAKIFQEVKRRPLYIVRRLYADTPLALPQDSANE
jgi:putative glycosyltransferase